MTTSPTSAAAGAATRIGDHADALFGFAMSRAADREMALDAVQEALTAAVARAVDGHQWPSDDALWGWLVTVCRRRLIDEFRRRRHRAPTLSSLGADVAAFAESVRAGAELPHELAGRAEAAAVCRAALAELPPHQRQAAEWFYRDGRSQQSIGDELGVSAKAVESLLARARQALHRILRRMIDSPEDVL